MPTIQKYPCKGKSIREIVDAFDCSRGVHVQNVSVEGDYASVYYTCDSVFDDIWFLSSVDEVKLTKEVMHKYNGYSSGEIALETGYNRGAIKEAMRQMEREGLGAYTMFDGMYYFWCHGHDSRE